MSTSAVIAIVVIAVVVLLLAAVAAAAARKRRSTQLREDFGPEYDRTVEDSGKKRHAEKELAARKDEHAQLELRPLSPAARQRYQESWMQVQAKFVDSPVLAVNEADSLVTRLLGERGYPTDDFDIRARLLSVEHAHVLDSYRTAHQIELQSQQQQATTEDIRNAMLDFRSVFEDVMADSEGRDDNVDAYPTDTDTRSTSPEQTRRI